MALTPPNANAYGLAFAQASKAAVDLGVAAALFHNAIDALAAATPHCDQCRWATSRGHRKGCRAEETAAAQ